MCAFRAEHTLTGRMQFVGGREGNTKTERKMSSKKVALKHLKLSGWMRTVRRVVFLIKRR